MKTFFTIIFFFSIIYIKSQTNNFDSLQYKKKLWSIETSIIWPIYPGIYKINFVRQIWEKKSFSGELGLSLNIQPERFIENQGYFSEEFMAVFYRQYFFKGFNIQIETNFAYGRIKNWPATGLNYESYAIFHDFTGGYSFTIFKKQTVSLTILPQAGGGFTSYVNSTWPRAENPYWLVNLLVGMHF